MKPGAALESASASAGDDAVHADNQTADADLKPTNRECTGPEDAAFAETQQRYDPRQHSEAAEGSACVNPEAEQYALGSKQHEGTQGIVAGEAMSGGHDHVMHSSAERETVETPSLAEMKTAKQAAHESPAAPAVDAPDPSSCLRQIVSFNTAKRNNLHMLDDETVIIAVGSVVLLLHVPTKQQRYLPGRDGGGIAAVAVHPNRQYFLVAEQCRSRAPNIYIYQYPSLDLCQTLPGGTEQAYSCAVFNADGSMVASVGSAPDYMLTLWEWQTAGTLLRCKAFCQEVYSVKFSPYFSGNLVTCGTGHIRFWKMATTFTGLKLQGQIGKFGSLELSDVAAFVAMPDGKVLSGCESGALLLWDGGLIKTLIRRPGGASCHAGPVEVLLHDTQTNYILSGGGDGMLRLWDFNRINDAEPEEGSTSCEIKPAAEVALPGGGCVRGVIWNKRNWLVLSDAGALLQVSLPINLLDAKGYTVSKVLEMHSGAVLGAYTCPAEHVLITGAGDGTVRAIDYRTQQVLQQRKFNSKASCMAMLPISADSQQRTAVMGFADGGVRLVRRCADGWRLLAAARPHKGKVSHVCISSDGSRLAAVAADGRIFFFQLKDNTLVPQLSCQLPTSSPTCCCWSPDYRKLLLGFSSGVALELIVPGPGSVDTSRTYEQVVASRSYSAKLPRRTKAAQQQKPQSAVQAATAAKQKNAAGTPAAADTSSSTAADWLQEQSQQQQQQQLEGQESDCDDPFKEQPILPITWVSYKEGNSSRFLLWVGGQAAGQVLECCWEQEAAISSTPAMPGAAVTAVSSSWSNKYSMLGSADGLVRLQDQLAQCQQPDSRYWQCPLHGMHDGQVTAVAMAHDDSCLISAASDGTLMLLSNPLAPGNHTAAAADLADRKLPTMSQDAAGQAEIADSTASSLTLEEAKQAAQRNMQAAAAAAAREQLVAAMEAMRKEYAALVAANNARGPGERVPQHMLEVDAGLAALVEKERAQKLADAHAQVAYEAELAQLQLNKLQQYFTSNLAVHHLTLFSMSGSSSVSTIRQAELPKELQLAIEEAEIEQVEQQRTRQQLQDSASRSQVAGARLSDAVHFKESSQQQFAGSNAEDSVPSLPGPNTSSVTSRADVWREAKKQRAAEWSAFNDNKPDETYEAPADVAALAEAAATIGDFKLKSDPGYVLPADQRLTPARKRQQMLLLMRDMAAAQSGYNTRVLGLREQKRGLLANLNAMRGRLAVINKLLGITEHLQDLTMLPEEEPEQQLLEVTPAQIAEHQAAKKAVAGKAASSGTTGGLGGFAAAGAAGTGAGKATSHGAKKKVPDAATCLSNGASSSGANEPSMSAVADISQAQRRKLQVEKQYMQGEMAALQSRFDAALATCRATQLDLAVSLKAAEGQLLLMTKELEVLKEAEVREVVLEGKLAAKAEEQAELAGRLAEVGRTLDAKKAEGDSAAARKAAVVAELDVLLAEHETYREQLTKVFNRKIKRNRRYTGGGGAGDDESGSDGDDAEGEEDEDEDTDDEEGGEVCPPGCDPSLYDRVVEMRERRLDEEEAAAEVNKALEGIKKEKELLTKKAKLIDQSLAAINQSVLEFQQEKQARLNQLPAILSMRLHQITYLEGGALPNDMSGALVFNADQLTRLKARMQELDLDRSALRQQQKELQRQHGQLQADQAVKQMRLSELTDKCRDVQLLKFGQVIDIALLDTIGVRNKGADELRDNLKHQTGNAAHELDEWDVKIAAKKRELLAITRENTSGLSTVTDLTSTQRNLEASVLAGRNALWQDPLDARRTAVGERNKLVSTINERARTLDSLRGRVTALKRKDAAVNV